jgi:hypothetical protein
VNTGAVFPAVSGGGRNPNALCFEFARLQSGIKNGPGMNAGAIFAAGRRCGGGRRLDQRYAGSLRALCALADFELNTLVLIEGLEAAGLDFGVVNEDITIGVIRGNEAEALFSVEPLDGSLCHLFLLIVEL